MYIKGYPPIVLTPDAPRMRPPASGTWGWDDLLVIETKTLESGKRARDYQHWSYIDHKSRIDVTFNPERTAVITIECFSDDRLRRCPPIAGVYDGDSEQEVIRKLGPPEGSRIQGVTKDLDYRTLGIRFTLAKEQVYLLSITDPGRDK
jgi:hypothetical protein